MHFIKFILVMNFQHYLYMIFSGRVCPFPLPEKPLSVANFLTSCLQVKYMLLLYMDHAMVLTQRFLVKLSLASQTTFTIFICGGEKGSDQGDLVSYLPRFSHHANHSDQELFNTFVALQSDIYSPSNSMTMALYTNKG